MPWIVTSQIKIYVFVFVSEEIHWIVEGTESEPHSDNCATRLGVWWSWDETAGLGVWWSWGETLQVWGCGGLGVRHRARLGVWWSWGETLWKTRSMIVLGWDSVQEWEYDGLGVRPCARLGVWWSWGETLWKTGSVLVLGWDTVED